MTLDVVNRQNEKVGSIDLGEAAFGGQADTGLVWEAVVQENAAARRGTHSTKTRGEVRGSGRKPWRQKGTGRARVGEIRNPLWRTGGTVFGPQPRSYAYSLPKKVVRRALRAALVQKLHDGAVTVVDQLSVDEPKTRQAVELLAGLDVAGSALLVDRKSGEHLKLAVRNLSKVRVVDSNQVTARDVAGRGPDPHDTGRGGASREGVGIVKQTDVIRRAIVTEKSSVMMEDRQILLFEVAMSATKVDVRTAVERLLGVKVADVRTAISHGKMKRQGRFVGQRPDWKKAYVRLKPGEKLPEFLEGS